MAYPVPARLATRIRHADESSVPIGGGVFILAARVAYRRGLPDPAALPATTQFLWLLQPRRLPDLSHLAGVRVVLASALKADQVAELVAQLPKLEVLCVDTSALASLAPLAGARRLKHLTLHGPRGLASLAGIEALPALRTLHVEDAPRLRRLPAFGAAATRLRGLLLAGGWNSRVVVDTLAPLAALRRLEHLAFWGQARDASLRAVVGLPRLAHLDLRPGFPIEELAAVRAAHPRVASEALQPLYFSFSSCRKCEGDMVKLVGVRGQEACKKCGRERIRAHVAKFEALVLASKPARRKRASTTGAARKARA